MTTLSMSRAWQETQAIVRRDGALLFPVAFALIALPGIIFRFLAPIDPLAGAAQAVEPGPWVLWFFPVLLLTLLGTLAVTVLALRSGTSVGEALGVSVRRLWVPLVASLLIGIAAVIVSLPLALLSGLGGGRSAVALLLLLMVVIGVVVSVRLMLIYPVTAAEPVGPVDAIRRSWRLTKGHFWRLFGFLLLAIVVAAIVALAVGAIGGVLVALASGGAPERGSVGALLLLLIEGILNAVISVFLVVVLARVYVALVDRG